MKKAIEKTVSVLKGVSTLDTITRNSRIILLLLMSIMALVGAARGGHSTLDVVDPSFNPQVQTSSLNCKFVDQIIPLPDGKILVAGTFNTYNRQPVNGLIRLNPDATLDTTFNSNLPSGTVQHMNVQADGKILVINRNNPQYRPLFRLNADGTLDPTFFVSGTAQFNGSLAIDANGRIIAAGSFYVGDGYRSITRFNSNGMRDPTFQPPLNLGVDVLATQNNKIIISYRGSPGEVQRLNENGTIDSSFITRNLNSWSMVVQPDGKILLLGDTDLRRLNADGSDDMGFTTTTFPFPPRGNLPQVLALSGEGKIILATPTGNAEDHLIRRFLADGTEDGSFTPYYATRFNTLAAQADGGVLIGDGDGPCFRHPLVNDFVRLSPNSTPDPTFDTGIGFQTLNPGVVQAINVQPDGKILIGGRFDFVNDVPRSNIARVNPDSTLDLSFQINPSDFSNIRYFYNIRTQSDGKIVATGGFDYYGNGGTKSNVVRLNSDGSIDPTFILGVQISDPEPYRGGTLRFVTYNDDKLLIGNSKNGINGDPVPVKLLATGERDTSFIPGVYQQDPAVWIYDVAVQPDGKIIIGGRHTTNQGDNKSFLTRLNADGSLDTTFQPREQLNKVVRSFVLLSNGKIVFAETDLTYIQSNVLRLNPDGSVDPTFNAGTGADGQVNAMVLLSTGRIFVGGKFTTFNGQPRANLVQLNADGSVFSPVYNLNDEVLSLAVDASGRVFVGGKFTTIIAGESSATRSYIAALIDASASSTRFDFDGDGRADLATFLAADGMWSILHSRNYQTVSINFGLSEDKPVAADFDGDFKTDYAVFRPSNGTWYVKESTNQNPNAFRAVRWGAAEDKPIAGDFDGDRKADFAVWRPSSAVWWILKSSNGASTAVRFGLTGDLPLSSADFDGDRQTDIAVWRPSDGNFYWLASGTGNQFNAVHFGINGDIPAVGDYNGDGKTDLVVYRPSEGNWYQYLSAPTGQYNFSVTAFGLNQDEPVAADYDGDGKTDIAVRRGNEWHILQSALRYSVQIFGDADARAVAAFSIQ